MQTTGKTINIVLAWLAAVVTASLLGSIIQTQFNLAAILRLDVDIPVSTWLMATLQDIVGFGAVYGMLVAVAFAIAYAVAALLLRWLPEWRRALFLLAGCAAIVVMIALMNAALPVTAIAATRDLAATMLMALAGVPAGWVYLRIRHD